MATNIDGKIVAILVTDGFEESELTEPKGALEKAGAEVTIITPKNPGEPAKGWQHDHWGNDVTTDLALDSADADDFDALVLPGGVMNPDFLRVNPKTAELVRAFFDKGKPVAAVCHGPWSLIEAGVVRNKRMTSFPSLKTDLRNAGADWVDEEVVVDGNLITSRNPDDLPAFNRTIIEVLSAA